MSSSNKRRRPRRNQTTTNSLEPIARGIRAGRYRPLDQTDLPRIDSAVRHTLTKIGLSEAPQQVRQAIVQAGGALTQNGRLTFTDSLIDHFLAKCQRNFTLYGQTADHDMTLSGTRVYAGTGGAAPQVVDLASGRYRDSTLQDLYDAARLVDTLDHIHFFSRSLVARDIQNEWLLDLNTAYVSLLGTRKHLCTSITQPEHVAPLAKLFHLVAGSREAFEKRPFVSLNINHVVPPLRYHSESMTVMAEAVKYNIPVHCNVFSQTGASTPVTFAGAIVQNTAEALAGMIFAWLINPEAKAIMGIRPMLTDLRTGGFSGGSGEQAQLMAATAQVAQYYDLPNSCIAGATDSKIPDAQSGYEKALTITLAAQAGSNLITQSCGMHAGLMSVAFESYVIDNDMLGSIMRSLAPLEIDETTLATQMIDEVIHGDGHFLGHPETYKRMNSNFLYPAIADRRSAAEWEATGSQDIRSVAIQRARQVLDTHRPVHLPADLDRHIRTQFDIRLPLTHHSS